MRQRRKTVLVLILSIFVVAGVSWSLHLNGESQTPGIYCGETDPSHTHTLACYSNPEADVETWDDWEKTMSEVLLSGAYGEDVIAIAQTQLGYSESRANYRVETDEEGTELIKGYTRYGAMYDDAYMDWDAAFVSFCLEYAGVSAEEFPYGTNVTDCVKALTDAGKGLYVEAAGYVPGKGDVVFFDTDDDEVTDHMGLVSECISETDKDGVLSYSISTIEGDISKEIAEEGAADTSDAVATRMYALDDETIVGYGKLSVVEPGYDNEGKDIAEAATDEPVSDDADSAQTQKAVDSTDSENGVTDVIESVTKSAVRMQRNSSAEGTDEGDTNTQDGTTDTIEEVTLNTNAGSRTYQTHFERQWDDNNRSIKYAIHVGDTVILELSNFEYAPAAVADGAGDDVVKFTTHVAGKGQSTYSRETVFQKIEFKALKKGTTSITLEGIQSEIDFPVNEDGNVTNKPKDFTGTKITLDIHVYDLDETPDYMGIYDPNVVHNHVDVEVEASFNIRVYDSDGKYETVKPNEKSVHVESVYATVYNTAALLDIEGYSGGLKKWNKELLNKPEAIIGGVAAPDVSPDPNAGGPYKLENVRTVSYNGKEIDAYDLKYQPKGTSESSGQYEFKCEGWGWHNLFDGDTVEMHVEISYKVGAESYRASQVVVVPICLSLSACPASTADDINHGFDVKVDMNDIVETEASYISKTDQYGNPVANAEFKFFTPTDTGKASITLTTDDSGIATFYNADNTPMNLKQLKDKIGDTFTMKEVYVPGGYRKMPTPAEFKIIGEDETGKNLYLTCTNPYDSGVWTNPSVRIEADDTLTPAAGESTITYYERSTEVADKGKITFNGKLYAVVMKKDAKGDYPVYGSDKDGYYLAESAGDKGVLELLSKKGHPGLYEFGVSDSGMFVSTSIQNLPGDPSEYETFAEDTGAKYCIKYYYQANGAAGIVEISDDVNTFDTHWGSTIEIANIENRLLFQKFDTKDHKISDAVFAMYKVDEDDATEIYYPVNEKKVYLDSDDDLDNKGTATVCIGDTEYTNATYEIKTLENFSEYKKSSGYITDADIGDITVTYNNGENTVTITITPATNAQGKELVGYTHDACDVTTESGTGHFEMLETGNYVIREIHAPRGYELNPTEVKVAVTDSGVYAYAGAEWWDNDNVLVGSGLGYLPVNLRSFANDGIGNQTLRWMFTKVGIIGGLGRDEKNDFPSADSSTFAYLRNNITRADGALKYVDGLLKGHSNSATCLNQEALVNYLEYDPGSDDEAYNYKVNGDQSGRNDQPVGVDENGNVQTADLREGSGTSFLYTTYGWSILEAYQDYAYGNIQNIDGYKSLNGKNLASMFSNSVCVAVKDKSKVDLTLLKRSDKKDENGNNLPLAGAEFELYKKVKEGGSDVNYYYSYDNGKVKWVKDKTKLNTQTDTFAGYMIPLPDGYTLAHGESLDIEMEYEGTGSYARIYLISGKNDNSMTNTENILNADGKNTSKVEGTLSADKGASDHICIKAPWGQSFTSLKINSIKLKKGESSIDNLLENIKPSDVSIVGLSDAKVTKADDGSISYSIEEYGIKEGYISFKDLDEGTYYLKETKAPEGYDVIQDEITITVGPQWGGSSGAPFVKVSGGWKAAEFDVTSPYYDSDSNAFQYGLTVVDESKGINLKVSKMAKNQGESLTALDGAEFRLYYKSNGVEYYYPKEYDVQLNDSSVWVNNPIATKTKNVDGSYKIDVKAYTDDNGKKELGEFGFAFPKEYWNLTHIEQVEIEYVNSTITNAEGHVEHYNMNKVEYDVVEDGHAHFTKPNGLGSVSGVITIDAKPGEQVFSTTRLFGLDTGTITIKSVKLIPVMSTWRTNINEAAIFTGSEFTIENLPDGKYYLREVVVPDGYNKPAQDVEITITDGEVRSVANSGDDIVHTSTEDDGTKSYSINVINVAGYELPSTGGMGNQLYTFGGLLLLTAPLLYGCVARQRRKGGGRIETFYDAANKLRARNTSDIYYIFNERKE